MWDDRHLQSDHIQIFLEGVSGNDGKLRSRKEGVRGRTPFHFVCVDWYPHVLSKCRCRASINFRLLHPECLADRMQRCGRVHCGVRSTFSPLWAILWAIDGASLVMAASLLAVKYFLLGNETSWPVAF